MVARRSHGLESLLRHHEFLESGDLPLPVAASSALVTAVHTCRRAANHATPVTAAYAAARRARGYAANAFTTAAGASDASSAIATSFSVGGVTSS